MVGEVVLELTFHIPLFVRLLLIERYKNNCINHLQDFAIQYMRLVRIRFYGEEIHCNGFPPASGIAKRLQREVDTTSHDLLHLAATKGEMIDVKA
jgi:hypothetical protein